MTAPSPSPAPGAAVQAPCSRPYLDETLAAPAPNATPIHAIVGEAFGVVVPLEASPGDRRWFLGKTLGSAVALVGNAKNRATEQLWLFKGMAPGATTIRLDYGVPDTRGKVTTADFTVVVADAPC